MSEQHLIRVTVNDDPHDFVVSPRQSLAEVLREELGLSGTHITCQMGICGACTVHIDGELVRSCLVLAVQADDTSVKTVESLGTLEEPSDLQRAFIEERALQCGFCTPGFLMLCSWYLRTNPQANDDEVREAVSSNLCRCTGYRGILRAVKRVRDERQASSTDSRA